METKHLTLKLTEISVSTSNEMFRDEHELTETALKDLTDSIKEHGVIQSIVVRPKQNKKANTLYELVCGERRFRASGYANTVTIPAVVRELTDDEAFSLQVTENLQRKDVHPLREAHAYQYLVDKDPRANTVAELALRFSKTESYVTTRLKLNDLIAQAKKDFAENLMTLGHALQIARLTADDQKTTIDRCTSWMTRDNKNVRVYGTVAALENHINQNVICSLDSAAFQKDDPSLVPKAGPCTICTKRSGASLLFHDVKEKDRCFDRACFLSKRMAFMVTQVPFLLDTEPELVYLRSTRDKVDPRIEKILLQHKVSILVDGTDFMTWDYSGGSKMKGIYINGQEVGKRVTVFSTKAKATKGKGNPEKIDTKAAIARIDERLERGRELDQEKIYSTIVELLKGNENFTTPHKSQPGITEKAVIAHMIFNHADLPTREILKKKLGLGKVKKEADHVNAFKQMYMWEIAYMARLIVLHQYSGPYMNDQSEGLLVQELAGEYGIDVDGERSKQMDIRKKREESAAVRKRQLKAVANTKKTKSKTSKLASGLKALIK